MQKYLIEVQHDPDPWACAKVIEIFLRTGSHYLAGADWGCSDGVHAAWMVVEAASREEARQVVPPPFRSHARIVQLNRFTLEGLARIMRNHPAPRPDVGSAASTGRLDP